MILESLRRRRRNNVLSKVIRDYRYFYKPAAKALYKRNFKDYTRALLFPFLGDGLLYFADGTSLFIPKKHWKMLDTTCLLKEIGAEIIWHADELEVELRGMRFFSPADARLTYLSLKGCLLEDVWRTHQMDLHGKKIMDVGAYLGHFAIACAKKGATVYAFEPIFHEFAKKNIERNGLQEKIFLYNVGISVRDETIIDTEILESMASLSSHGGKTRSAIEVSLVEAVNFFRKHSIGKVDFLKLNCEGAEYGLLADKEFLDILDPDFISMEYHDGGSPIYSILQERGYQVEWTTRDEEIKAKKDGQQRCKGKIFAQKLR